MKCRGYASNKVPFYKWQDLMHPGVPFSLTGNPGLTPAERSSFAFFRHKIAPILSGSRQTIFWTVTTLSLAHENTAVRRASLALGSAFEAAEVKIGWRGDAMDSDALRHYNLAIQDIISNKTNMTIETVLVLCIIFVCIEFSYGNPAEAFKHLCHGITLFNTSDASPQIGSMLRHLSVEPRAFGADISPLPVIRNTVHHASSSRVTSVRDLEMMLDPLTYDCARLQPVGNVRQPITDSGSDSHEDLDEKDIEANREKVEQELDSWWAQFHDYKSSLSRTMTIKSDQTLLLLEVRWLAAKIWNSTAYGSSEYMFDAHLSSFRRIVDASFKAKQSCSEAQERLAFKIGFNSFLYFTAAKCRHLQVRLMALSLMENPSPEQQQQREQGEAMWHQPMLCVVARKIVEMEHSASIQLWGGFYLSEGAEQQNWPLGTERVVQAQISGTTALEWALSGRPTHYRVPIRAWSPERGYFERFEIAAVS